MGRATWVVAALVLGSVLACSDDPTGPSAQVLVQLQPAGDSVRLGAPGQALDRPVLFRALDPATRRPVAGATVVWTVTGGGRLDSPSGVTDDDGYFDAVWVLGTRAADAQKLSAEVLQPRRDGVGVVRAVAIPSEVAAIRFVADTTPVLVGTTRRLWAVATDSFGNRFVPHGARFISLDTAIVTVDSLARLHPLQGGFARVAVVDGAATDTSVIRVIQVLQAINVNHDTLGFSSLRQIDTLQVTLLDSAGRPVTGLLPAISIADTSIARIVRTYPALVVTSLRNGSTTLQLDGGGVVRQVAIVVQQQAAAIQVTTTSANPIISAALGSILPLRCRVVDGNGYDVALDPAVTTTGDSVLAGSTCSDLRVQRSGLDTLHVSAGGAVAVFPVAVAVPPAVSSPMGDFLQVDSLPPGQPWAPSGRVNSRGQFELYFAQATTDSEDRMTEDLHRLVSEDGIHFRYDGLVLQHDATECSLTGFGFENVAIVPRQEAPGWRMYVAAGQFDCYGWQVFSAVSTDERNWTLEPGIRLWNGPTQQPVKDVPDVYWPTGEGMVVDRAPASEGGGWRMLVGAGEHLDPYEDRFQIIEWDSPDQLNWSYRGPVLSTRQMPAAGAGNVYSPTIRQVAPGLWRMIFTADNRKQDGWRSGLWSAVSTDLQTWQVEGQLLGSNTTQLFYSTMVGDRVVFIRWDDGGDRRLASATVSMP
jgi:hypothetical protein